MYLYQGYFQRSLSYLNDFISVDTSSLPQKSETITFREEWTQPIRRGRNNLHFTHLTQKAIHLEVKTNCRPVSIPYIYKVLNYVNDHFKSIYPTPECNTISKLPGKLGCSASYQILIVPYPFYPFECFAFIFLNLKLSIEPSGQLSIIRETISITITSISKSSSTWCRGMLIYCY